MTQRTVPQMQYLELIKFIVGNQQIGDYWQRVSGGDLTVASAEHKRGGTRGSTYIPGRYKVNQVTLERDYVPDNTMMAIYNAIMQHLRDPGNDANGIIIRRVMQNSPTGNANGKTTIDYLNCKPVGLPNFGDGDVTNDAGMITQRMAFEVEDLAVTLPGQSKPLDTAALLRIGWTGAPSAARNAPR